jgi:hypothetical protein
MKKKAYTLAHTRQLAKNTYTPHPMLVYICGRALVTTSVQIHTLAAAKGPETERMVVGKISAEMIQGRPLACFVFVSGGFLGVVRLRGRDTYAETPRCAEDHDHGCCALAACDS